MNKTLRLCLLFGCLSAVTSQSSLAQETAKEQLSEQNVPAQPAVGPREATFREATQAFERANELNAGFLSPTYFSEARKSYLKAMEIYDRGGKLADVRANLSKCMQNLQLATKTAELCQVALKEVLALRDETLATGLSFDRSGDFREGEKKLQQAAQKMEKGDLKGTQKPSREAAQRYRKAVLQVVEKQLLPDAKRRLKGLKSSYTKADYKRAEDALKKLEQQVKSQEKVSFSIAVLTSQVREEILRILTPQPTAAQGAQSGD